MFYVTLEFLDMAAIRSPFITTCLQIEVKLFKFHITGGVCSIGN